MRRLILLLLVLIIIQPLLSMERDLPPGFNIVPSKTTGICPGTEVTYTLSGASVPSNCQFDWEVIGGDIIDNDNYSIVVRWTFDGTNEVYVSGCTKSDNISVTVGGGPIAPPEPTVNIGCGSSEIIVPNPPAGVTYYWESNPYDFSTGNVAGNLTVTASGIYYLKARTTSGCWSGSRSISVTVHPTPLPLFPDIINECNVTTVFLGTPPENVQYFWDATGGTSEAVSGNYKEFTSSTTTYVRAKNIVTGCWGSSRKIDITVNSSPKIPEVYAISSCSNTRFNYTIPAGETYYFVNSATDFSTTTPITSSYIEVNTSKTYYIRSRNNITSCWGPTWSYTVIAKTTPPLANIEEVENCGYSELIPTSYDGSITYYWQPDASSFSSAQPGNLRVNGNVAGTYYVRGRNAAGCWGGVSSITLNNVFYPAPQVPPTPIVNYSCSSATLSHSAPPSGITYYWQNSFNGTSLSESSALKVVTTNGAYYLRAKNNTLDCWSEASVVNVTLIPFPTVSGSNVARCGEGRVELQVTGTPAGNTYKWYTVPSGGTPITNASPDPSKFTTPTLYVTKSYYVSAVNSLGCESERIEIKAIVTSAASLTSISGEESLFPGSQYTFNAEGIGSNKTYAWEVPSGHQIISGQGTSKLRIKAGSADGVILVTSTSDCNSVSISKPISVLEPSYIRETTLLIPATQTADLTVLEKSVSTTYFDGLGRPMQQVNWQSSSDSKKMDIIQPIVYDQYNREYKKYLPYVGGENGGYKPDFDVEQAHFYQVGNDAIINDNYPYALTDFEKSPLNRIKEQGAPGLTFQPTTLVADGGGKSIGYNYSTNGYNEVMIWKINTSNLPETNSYYKINQLSVLVTKDEHGAQIKEYKDKEGRVILKKVQVNTDEYAHTYYIYDDLGNLACVLPPEAVKGILSTPTSEYFDQNDDVKNAFLEKWAFRYSYDHRQRMIEKQVPGAGKVIMAYDQRDRLVITQDAAQANRKEWTYTKYDALNRPIVNGIYVKTVDIETMRDNIKNHAVYFESSNTTTGDYTLNQSFPTDVDPTKILSVTYYDNYDFVGQSYFDSENLNYAFTPNELVQTEDRYPYSKGLVTGTKTKVLGKDKWLNSVSYYDSKNRVIQSISKNYIGGQDIISNQYDFVGKTLKTKQEHTGIKPLVIHQEFKYDHVGRLKEQWQQIGDDQNKKVLLAENKYNELGQLVDKGIGVKVSETGRVPLQSIDYRYNIRGWLTNINRSDLGNDEGATNDDNDDKFGMEMLYENIDSLMPRR